MAVVKSSSQFDSRDLTILRVIQTARFSHQSADGYRANIGPGDYVAFEGYGFSYYGGRPFQGTTTELTVYDNNKIYYQASGLSITIAEFIRYSRMTTDQLAQEIFEGNDVFVGSRQADYMAGYDGNDTYIVKNAGTQVVEKAGDGIDTVKVDIAGSTSGLGAANLGVSNFTLADNSSIENLFVFLLGSTYALNLTGNTIANTIKGNAGLNVIDGDGGRDILWGGKGRDTFVFDVKLAAGNRDAIMDFNSGGAQDIIELSRGIFRELDIGRLDASDFKSLRPGATLDGNDHILYHRKSGWVSYDPDGRGGEAAKTFVKIDNHAALTFDDFLVVA